MKQIKSPIPIPPPIPTELNKPSKEFKNVNNETIETIGMRNIVEYGKFSFALEEKREESLNKISTGLLTTFAVISLLISFRFPKNNPVFSAIIFVLLCLNSVFILFANWRFKYGTIQDAKGIFDEISKNYTNYNSQENFDMRWIYMMSKIQKGKKKINDKRLKFVMSSQVLFLVIVLTIVISTIF
jgi:hypothetical protein